MSMARLLPAIMSGLFMLPAIGYGAGKCQRLIVTGDPDTPPYLWRNPQNPKHLIGANADLIVQAGKAIGVNVDVLYAGKRSQAIDEVHSGRMDLLINAPLTVSELESVDYIHPALIQGEVMLVTLGASAALAAPSPAPDSDKTGLFLALSFNSACNEPWLRGQLAKKMTEFAASALASDAVKRNLELWKAQAQQPAGVPNT
ncbi:MAG: transporter substrate-binding domain-containing protein [Pseudomonas sp.]